MGVLEFHQDVPGVLEIACGGWQLVDQEVAVLRLIYRLLCLWVKPNSVQQLGWSEACVEDEVTQQQQLESLIHDALEIRLRQGLGRVRLLLAGRLEPRDGRLLLHLRPELVAGGLLG